MRYTNPRTHSLTRHDTVGFSIGGAAGSEQVASAGGRTSTSTASRRSQRPAAGARGRPGRASFPPTGRCRRASAPGNHTPRRRRGPRRRPADDTGLPPQQDDWTQSRMKLTQHTHAAYSLLGTKFRRVETESDTQRTAKVTFENCNGENKVQRLQSTHRVTGDSDVVISFHMYVSWFSPPFCG